MAKISFFIIMMIVFNMILIGGFGSFLGSINSNYNPDGFNDSRLEAYNKLTELSEQVSTVENETRSLRSRSGFVDTLGGFVEAAYNSIKISFNSITIFEDMAAQAKEDIPNLERINVFYIGAITIVIVILTFIILRIIFKSGDI